MEKGPANCKNIEKIVIDLLNNEKNIDYISDLFKESEMIYKLILSKIDKDILFAEKPKVFNEPNYGNKNEPKSDIVVYFKDKTFETFSLKRNDSAYIFTSNSKDDLEKVFFSNGLVDILDHDTLKEMNYIFSNYVNKIPNFDKWNKKYKKCEDYIIYKTPKLKDWVNEEKYNLIIENIKNKYEENKGKNVFNKILRKRESCVQKMFKKLFFEYEEYSKKVIFEMLTGNFKFEKDKTCSANYIVYPDKIYKLDYYDCDYVNIYLNKQKSKKKIGRLQNVPRHGLSKEICLKDDIIEIVNSFPVADLSIKI